MTPDFTREQQAEWFMNLPKSGYLIWGVECDGIPVGAVGLKNFRKFSAEYFGYIGEREYWGRGLGREIIAFGVAAARKCRLSEIEIRVRSDNLRAVHLYYRTGFVSYDEQDGVLRMRKQIVDSAPHPSIAYIDPHV